MTLAVCEHTLKVPDIEPDTVMSEVGIVGNGFFSAVGYQAQGFSAVTINWRPPPTQSAYEPSKMPLSVGLNAVKPPIGWRDTFVTMVYPGHPTICAIEGSVIKLSIAKDYPSSQTGALALPLPGWDCIPAIIIDM